MKTFIGLLLSISVIVIALHSGCIMNPDEISIVNFSANPSIIQPGNSTTIHWEVIGAVNVSIQPFIGDVDLVGNKTITLNQTTMFTLNASSKNETLQKTIVITVQDTSEYSQIIIDNQKYADTDRDPFDIINVSVNTDLIIFDVGYSGGCENHTFQLISKEMFMESDPVQIDVVLSHDDKNDPCDAYIYDTIVFDLSNLKQKWQNEYQTDSGTIIIRIENHTEVIGYRFGEDLFSFINVSILTDKDVYGINETIFVQIFVENKKTSDITLEFPSSKIADFHCMDSSGDILYTWSYERMFLSVITPLTIQAESTIEIFNFSWSRMDNDGMVLENGTHLLQGFIPGFYYVDDSIDYSKKPGPIIYSGPVEITFI